MVHVSCPTALVNAPIETVWDLLTQPAGWGDFYDVRILRVEPRGVAVVGQIVSGETGPRFLHLPIRFRFFRIDPVRYELGFDVQMPLGITVREDMTCVPVDRGRCRVNYHCAFDFPTGWRGALLRRVLRRGVDSGPADSISRLRKAAEKRCDGGAVQIAG